MTSIMKRYQKLIQSQALMVDNAQIDAVLALDELAKTLAEQQSVKKSIFNKFFHTRHLILGLYLHGRVGRGKTMLMDMFYQQVSIKRKKRIHFHHFMENVHLELARLAGQEDPLQYIATYWASTVDLLCFDEFYVSDIADAMLLSGLFNVLFEHGVVIVCTSNCAPDELYRNGLQRERFLPTISMIKQYCQTLSVDGCVDHRLEKDINVSNTFIDYPYFCTNPENKAQFLAQHFADLAEGKISYQGNLSLLNREIPLIARADNIIWFDFMALCSGPRSQRDYIKLADTYSTVLISDIPQFDGHLIPAVFSGVEDRYQRSGVVMGDLQTLDDEARRFIALVDEFYDRNIRLIVTAAVDIGNLYQGKQLAFEFARCRSRLYEMQRM